MTERVLHMFQAWRNGGYSDDLVLAALCTQAGCLGPAFLGADLTALRVLHYWRSRCHPCTWACAARSPHCGSLVRHLPPVVCGVSFDAVLSTCRAPASRVRAELTQVGCAWLKHACAGWTRTWALRATGTTSAGSCTFSTRTRPPPTGASTTSWLWSTHGRQPRWWLLTWQVRACRGPASSTCREQDAPFPCLLAH